LSNKVCNIQPKITQTIVHVKRGYNFEQQNGVADLIPIFTSGDNTTDATVTNLRKYQWDYIHNPENIVGLFEDDSEGEANGFSDYAETRQIIDQIRFGYAFNKSITISYNKSFVGANNITLGDEIKYKKLLISFNKTLPITINPRLCELPEDFSVLANMDALRTGFCFAKQTNSRTFYTIEIESKTANNEFANLKKYLLCEDKEKWSSHIDRVINNGGYSLANLSALPNEALMEISNTQRIKLLEKIAKANIDDYYPLAAKIMLNVPQNQITDLFTKLNGTIIFYKFKNQMNHDNYTKFIKATTLLYYQQDGLKDTLINLPYNRMFVNQEREGDIGASIRNSFLLNQTNITITGNVIIVTGIKNPYGRTIPNGTKAFQAYSNTVGYCDLIGLELVSDFGNLKADSYKDIIPLPAFYFDWIQTNIQRENIINAIDATITIASLAVGVSELRMAIKGGQYIYVAYLSVGVALTSYNLVRFNSDIDTYFDQIAKSNPDVKEFFELLDIFAILYDMSNIVVSRIVTKDNKQFFNDFIAAWTDSKEDIFDHILNHSKGGKQEAKKITDEFKKLVTEIIAELNKK